MSKSRYGHSNVTHYKNPGIKTNDVEAFIAAAKMAGTVETIKCAQKYDARRVEQEWAKAGAASVNKEKGAEDMESYNIDAAGKWSAQFGGAAVKNILGSVSN